MILKEVMVGVALAFVQATVSVALLKWSWRKKSFYAWWGACTLARFLVFEIAAVWVHQRTNWNLAVVLLSLAGATMAFMIVEVKIFLTPKK